MVLKYKTTADIPVAKRIVDQVIGQEAAVNIIKKAAQQRRHVFLIGEPGTGKSMLGMALAELLPKEKLVDILAFPNPNDENQPLIRTVPASQGRQIIAQARMQTSGKAINLVFILLILASFILPYWWWRTNPLKLGETANAIIFASSMLGAMLIIAGFVISLRMSRCPRALPRISSARACSEEVSSSWEAQRSMADISRSCWQAASCFLNSPMPVDSSRSERTSWQFSQSLPQNSHCPIVSSS